MKKIQFYILGLIISSLVFASSCGEDFNPLFTMETDARFQIDAGLNTINTYFFQLRDVPTFFDVFSAGVNLDSAEISQIIGRDCMMNPVGDIVDLDFIHSINVYILDPSDINQRYEIFFTNIIEFGSKERIRLFNSVVDVQDFMREPTVNMEVEINFRQIPLRTVQYQLDMGFSAFGQR